MVVAPRIIPARAGFTQPGDHRRVAGEDHPRSRGVYQPGLGGAYAPQGSSPLARGLHPARDLVGGQPGIIPARAGFTWAPGWKTGYPRDHPRSRGVYSSPPAHAHYPWGSSPLARGLPAPVTRIRRHRGIIPARAGFTYRISRGAARRQDHPRSRGVYTTIIYASQWGAGSSPLARGLPVDGGQGGGGARIIPARAGFTCRPHDQSRRRRDHPRSRGVYHHRRPVPAVEAGSSPLARGLRFPTPPGLPAVWIIPARAGFTLRRLRGPVGQGDHPRSRGVYDQDGGHAGHRQGSSPLARGLLDAAADPHGLRGIIPARAGFTPCPGRETSQRWDHPRSRGVYRREVARQQVTLGSSPLARGLRTHEDHHRRPLGIIPARAGFTWARTPPLLPAQDHPRSRGVYVSPPVVSPAYPGSSPLARGLRGHGRGDGGGGGIIPARAGFTGRSWRPRPPPTDHPRSRGVYARP